MLQHRLLPSGSLKVIWRLTSHCFVMRRDVWEETSFALERLQAAEECVDQEQSGLKSRTAPTWKLNYTPAFTAADKMSSTDKVYDPSTAAVALQTPPCTHAPGTRTVLHDLSFLALWAAYVQALSAVDG